MVTTEQLASRPRLTIAQICRLVPCDPSTVWRWSHTGLRGVRLQLHRLAGRKFAYQDELDEFLKNTTNAKEAA